MGIEYDNAVTSGSGIPGTMQFVSTDAAERGKNRIDRHHAHDSNQAENNGKSVMFTITIDPSKIFSLGVSQFTLSAIAWGMHLGVFPEGTEWMSPTGRVRIMKGKLKYTRNKGLYPLPVIKE